MNTFLLASQEHLPAIRKLISTARYSYKNIGDEDLRLLLASGALVLGYDGPALWGALGIVLEERPPTLPNNAFNRGSLNIAAFMPGYWPGDWLPTFLKEVDLKIPARARPLRISSYSPAAWMERGLLNGGFEIEEQIVSMAIDKLEQSTLPTLPPPLAHLRPATPVDLPIVAAMDAEVFEPLWHFSTPNLRELLWRGWMQIALQHDKIVGYSSLLNNSQSEAQLARLAVAPSAQGNGIGRQLLLDTIETCRQLGYRRLVLNTQVSNVRSQNLYASFGFRPFGDKVFVLTKSIY